MLFRQAGAAVEARAPSDPPDSHRLEPRTRPAVVPPHARLAQHQVLRPTHGLQRLHTSQPHRTGETGLRGPRRRGSGDRGGGRGAQKLSRYRDRQARHQGHHQGGRVGLPHGAAPPLSSRSGGAVGSARPGRGVQRRGLRPVRRDPLAHRAEAGLRPLGQSHGAWLVRRQRTRNTAGTERPRPTIPPTSCRPCSSGSARRDRPISRAGRSRSC